MKVCFRFVEVDRDFLPDLTDGATLVILLGIIIEKINISQVLRMWFDGAEGGFAKFLPAVAIPDRT